MSLMDSSVGDALVDKAARKTLRALKEHPSGKRENSSAVAGPASGVDGSPPAHKAVQPRNLSADFRSSERKSPGDSESWDDSSTSFKATLYHSCSNLFLQHKEGDSKLSGTLDSSQPECVFEFEPHEAYQMNNKLRPQGHRVRSAQGYFFVAVLGRRCTSRLLQSDSMPVANTPEYERFCLESTAVFNVNSELGALYFLHHSSADLADVFFFSLAPIIEQRLVEAECSSMKKGVSKAPGWRYLRIDKI